LRAGCRPYQQVPFQWSCPVDHGAGRIEHHAYLDVTGQNPARDCAEKLLATLGEEGVIVAYHSSFEEQVLTTLADMLPDLERRLLAARARIVDLLPIVREHYYHRDMMGSFSIKAVLRTIAPQLDHASLDEVQEGARAAAGLSRGEHTRRRASSQGRAGDLSTRGRFHAVYRRAHQHAGFTGTARSRRRY
jgi:Domain of unknown function(DUF2779)